MTRLFSIVAMFWCSVIGALAANDDTYISYLNKNDLKPEECASNAPNALFKILQERKKLSHGGTPGQQATTVDVFYHKYLAALQPVYNDSHSAEVAKARGALRDLYYYITDAFLRVTSHRTYITHERIDAFVEHLVVRLAESGVPLTASNLDLSVDDAAAYLRTRYILMDNVALVVPPDFDAFRSEITTRLRRIGKAHGIIEPFALHYYVVSFADDYQTPLSPE